jgi:hypothetical protein
MGARVLAVIGALSIHVLRIEPAGGVALSLPDPPALATFPPTVSQDSGVRWRELVSPETSTFSRHAPGPAISPSVVLLVGDEFHVLRVHAMTDAAQVVDFQPFGNRAPHYGPHVQVSQTRWV